ncbi:MAG: UDP-N-acetylmuramoyl-L-alanyl-D-glutamate--2,6-diaminopimelate ligase [Candidatus Latescibacteria bacterium]|nr:UDP-N-acetylmuramoyl-L-alanyl-D-glutamate--2,6-diaminopimelate ligase [Candidatus Latescibacterota bacterium]
MKLNELFTGIDNIDLRGDSNVNIESLQYDSRKVTNGSLFIAVKGFTIDGNSFIADAVRKGTAAILTAEPCEIDTIPVIRVPDIRKTMAIVSDRFYGSPQNALVMTGITGTNGKTTTSYMVKSIFEAGGFRCGLIGTISHLVADKKIQASNTTPEAPDIHSYLASMVAAHQSACVMEVSSHALELSRVYGIKYRAAAFTNITRDHLDFHGSIERYLDAKSILFSSLPGDSAAVINRDDRYSDHIINVSRDCEIFTYGFDDVSDIRPISYELNSNGSKFRLYAPVGEIEVSLKIPGRFNISNAMAATGIGIACGFPKEIIAKGFMNMEPVKGRFETVDEGQPFSVFIDYAHAPDALERILTSVRELTSGRLISVFGCGGDRDRGKRPIMGEISTRIADVSVITSDNPRSENPMDIIQNILQGISGNKGYEIFPDRADAIKYALEAANPGDAVVIAGKGHEDYQVTGTVRKHFDDAETARQILRSLK